MRAPLSVIIPTLNAEERLPGCLASLYEGVSEGLIRELIVADGGSTDATPNIADDVGAEWIPCSPSRGGQLRAGADRARGEWLLFVHADTVLQEGWTEIVEAHIKGSAKAGYFDLKFDVSGAPAHVVAGWANLRSWLFSLPYGDQGLLISRRFHKENGGFDDIPLMEDVALARRIGRRGFVRLRGQARTSAQRYISQGWLRRGARNLWTLARFFVGVSPERLAREYRAR